MTQSMTVLVVARGERIIDRMISLMDADGITAEGTLDDDDAVSKIEGGGISTLIIGGGVEPPSRERLKAFASRNSVRVIEGELGGTDPETYFKEELLPILWDHD